MSPPARWRRWSASAVPPPSGTCPTWHSTESCNCTDGGHRRYSRDDLHRADRARQLIDDGVRMDAAVRIVSLEYQLAAAHAMIDLLGRKSDRQTRAAKSDLP
jgi:hypothetical protein